eukprot:CAMPEP_0117754018 /NCGR_PEP_ID=MMETSP0947-20121206/12582_1 /TAXON_ID=44440 /ORGANISM="Chattonella subsalsa, Strain CCMP2191" /LENGTH=294 /DNA_ID=CAMNT_0005573033 /DNA_START=56 /DNA_END=937 /DNA_ORIENTATION=+
MREDWQTYIDGEKLRWNGLADIWNRWMLETEVPEENSFKLNEKMFEYAAIGEGMKVLDLCTGNGEVALHLARRVGSAGRVVAVEQSGAVLEYAKQHCIAAGLAEQIEFLEMDAHQIDFEDNSFDAVICRFGIFFLPDLPLILQKILKALKPGGVFVCNVWGATTESFDFVAKAVKQFELAEIDPDSTNTPVLRDEEKDEPRMLQPVHFSSNAANAIASEMLSVGFDASDVVSVNYINVFDSPEHYMIMNAPFSSAGHGVLSPGSEAWNFALENVTERVESDGKIRLNNDVDLVW